MKPPTMMTADLGTREYTHEEVHSYLLITPALLERALEEAVLKGRESGTIAVEVAQHVGDMIGVNVPKLDAYDVEAAVRGWLERGIESKKKALQERIEFARDAAAVDSLHKDVSQLRIINDRYEYFINHVHQEQQRTDLWPDFNLEEEDAQ